MTILDDIRKAALISRRDKGHLSAFYSFVISEIVKIGKNDGNRESTDAETISVLKKLVDKAKSNLELVKDEDNILKFQLEIKYLEVFLPVMVSDDDIVLFLNSTFRDSLGHEFGTQKSDKGLMMKALKEKFGVFIDMKKVPALEAQVFCQ